MLISDKSLNPNSFSVKIKQTVQSTHRIIGGEGSPSFKYVYGILSAFKDIDANWLILGEGDMMKKTDSEITSLRVENKQLREMMEQWREIAKLKTHK